MVHSILIRDDFSNIREELTSSVPPFTLSEFITKWKSSDVQIIKIPLNHSHARSSTQGTGDDDPFTALMPVDLISQTLKRAYFEFVQTSASDPKANFAPYISMIHKLYGQIRALVPSRPDLHPLLNDDDVKASTCCCADEMLAPLIQAGEALVLLEAPIRTESTSEWLRCAKWLQSGKDENMGGNGDTFGMNMVEFSVASTVFLLVKADLCSMDIAHDYLLKVVPYIKRIGNDYERDCFQKIYGAYPNNCSVPYTKEWLRSIYKKWEVDETTSVILKTNKEAVTRTIRTQGFVNSLLFYNNVDLVMPMPEIFEMDVAWMNQIRGICRSAVIGSALFVQVCRITSTPSSQTICSVHPLSDSLRSCKDLLAAALTKKYSNNQDLEDGVVSSVENIAKTLCPSLTTAKLHSLRGCSIAIIRGGGSSLERFGWSPSQAVSYHVCAR